MFSRIFNLAISSLLQRWLLPLSGGFAKPADFPAIQPNIEGIKALAVRYATFSILVFLNFQLFIGGLLITLVAVAHSFDVNQQFYPSSLFITGLITTFTALIVGAGCAYGLLSTKVNKSDLILPEQMDYAGASAGFSERFFRPILAGVAEGLRQPRAHEQEDFAFKHPA